MALSRPIRFRLMTGALLGLAACGGSAETGRTHLDSWHARLQHHGHGRRPSVLNGVYQLDWSYEDLA